MRFNGTTVPTTRDDTYDTTEVHRKSKDELYETAFNQDQREILDNLEPGGGGGSSLPDVTESDNGKVLAVVEGKWDKAELDLGYECIDDRDIIFDETATTVNDGSVNDVSLAYSSDITLEYVNVTFDGVDYLNVPRVFDSETQSWIYGEVYYGMPVFTTYPFMLRMQTTDGNMLCTETAGAHTVEVWTGERTVTTTECFREAVKSVNSPFVVNVATSGDVTALDKTWEEILDAFVAGISVLIKGENSPNQYSSVVGVYDGLSYDISDGSGNYYTTGSADGYPAQS